MSVAHQRTSLGFFKRLIATAEPIVGWNVPLSLPEENLADGPPLAPLYILNASVALLSAAIAANASRAGRGWAEALFYASIVWLYFPLAAKAFAVNAMPRQRFQAVLVATVALFIVKIIREPIGFIDHDEFQHWTTVNHILDSGRLFAPNALLPVSPLYPGLEAATTAIVSLSGLTVFQAATVVLAVCRIGFISALFFIYKRISNSARVAASGCFIYMGASTFLVFDTQFAYGSLAIFLMMACILADTISRTADRARISFFVTAPLIAADAITHHMTSYLLAAYFTGVAALSYLRRPRRVVCSSFIVAAWATAAPLLWAQAMGNPETGYLGPVLLEGAHEFMQVLTFSVRRALFEAPDGYITPLWQRITSLAAVMLICAGLAVGFFRSLGLAGLPVGSDILKRLRARAWKSDILIVFTLATLAFPASMLFRLTISGWEIGNRLGPFSFIGVGVVVAIGMTLQRGRHRPISPLIFAGAAATVVVGGVISAQGPRILVPHKFHVAADAESIGWLGIDTAEWTRTWLGERNLFASDRTNRLLLSTYGRQDVASSLQDKVNLSSVILGEALGPAEINLLRVATIDYVAVDLRMSTQLPGVGAYIDGDDGDQNYRAPPPIGSLLKFDTLANVGRIFDNGYILIYDTRVLHGPT